MELYDAYGFYGDYSDFGVGTSVGLGALMGVYILILLFAFAVGLVIWLLQSIGVYKMAKTAGINNAWLAFIPIGFQYVLGKLAEVPTGNKKPLRYGVILPLLSVGAFVVYIALFFVALVAGITSGFAGDYTGEGFENTLWLLLSVAELIMIPVSILISVFTYIALYRVYKLFDPNNAVIYLVLSILISILQPIFLFVLRNKPVYGYGFGQVPPVGVPGYNPAYGDQTNSPYGDNVYMPPVPGQTRVEEQAAEKVEEVVADKAEEQPEAVTEAASEEENKTEE